MKQHLFKSLRSHGFAGPACSAAGLVLMIAASPALAQDGQHMMGADGHMMGSDDGQVMMGNTTGQGMMNDGDYRNDMMGADGHMMGKSSHDMMSNDHGMRGRDDQ